MINNFKSLDKETLLKTVWVNIATLGAYFLCASEYKPETIALISLFSNSLTWILRSKKMKDEKDKAEDWKRIAKNNHVDKSNENSFSFSLSLEEEAMPKSILHKYGPIMLKMAKKCVERIKEEDLQTSCILEFQFSEPLWSYFYMKYLKITCTSIPIRTGEGRSFVYNEFVIEPLTEEEKQDKNKIWFQFIK